MREDEIDVGGYVMKKDVRGTSKDPRAMDHERWIVNVEMIADLRRLSVQTDQPHWEKVKIGDRVKVIYRQGKYTGTVLGRRDRLAGWGRRAWVTTLR